MAISPIIQYPGKVAPVTIAYPYGGAQNITTPGDGTGTPWEAALLNDHFGFQQALLKSSGIVPSGSPDQVGASEYLQSIVELASGRAFNYTAGGTVDAITLATKTNQEGPQSLFVGLKVSFVATGNNTGSVTINANGTGVKTVKNGATGSNLVADEIVSGNSYTSTYNGVNYILDIQQLVTAFTPTIRGSTTAGAPTGTFRGDYIRIGNVVFINIHITLTALGGMTGQPLINNLPVLPSSKGTSGLVPTLNFGLGSQLSLPANYLPAAIVTKGIDRIGLSRFNPENNSTSLSMDITHLNNNSVIFLNGFYGV